MRESLGRAVNSSDLEQYDYTCSLDKVHALALAQGMPDMIRFLDGLHAKSYKAVVYTLAKRSRLKINRYYLIKLCELAVYETCFSFCPDCLGAKELMAENLKVTCRTCQGSGVRRHTDTHRARYLGMDISTYRRGWNNHLESVFRVLTDNYRLASSSARHRLTDE